VKPITEMNSAEAFVWIRQHAPSAGEITYAVDPISYERTIYLERATVRDAQRLRTALAIMSPVIGADWRVKVTGRTHIYFWQGRWWTTKNGRRMWREGFTLNDVDHASFADACASAQRWMSYWLGRKRGQRR